MPRRFLHVNQNILRQNLKTGERNPCITVKDGKSNTYCHCVEVRSSTGELVARLETHLDSPLSCGARIYFVVQPTAKIILDPPTQMTESTCSISDAGVFANMDSDLKLNPALVASIPTLESSDNTTEKWLS